MNPSPTDARRPVIDEAQASWSEYRRLVIAELERINATLERIQRELAEIRTEVALLKFKASVWGVLAGAISGAMVTAGAILLRGYG